MLPLLRVSFLLFMLGLCLIMAAGSARAQWAVYDMRMVADEDASVNFVHYTGVYVVAPLGGGNASLIFTTEDGGRLYATAQDAAKFFVAGNLNKRRAVVAAQANIGSSQTMYLASGAMNSTFQYVLRGERNVAIIANDLSGQLMTADDEGSALPSLDGSKGVMGTASFKGFFRRDLSERLSAEAPTMDQAVEGITALLEKYGYQSETVPVRPATAVTTPTTSSTSSSEAAVPFRQDNAPQPATDTVPSLFPAGMREEMEKMLLQESITK